MVAHVDPAKPDFWLVFALPWPENNKNVNECLLAIAPQTIPDVFGPDVRMVKEQAIACWQDRPRDVILFADVTKYLSGRGESWDDLGVNWEAALSTLSEAQVLGSFLNATYEAYVLASTNSDLMVTQRGTEDAKVARSMVRVMLAKEIMKDWANYVETAKAEGRIAEW